MLNKIKNTLSQGKDSLQLADKQKIIRALDWDKNRYLGWLCSWKSE